MLPAVAPAPGLACSAAAISGFAALAYEVAWTRLLALVIGPTTYAFATMAAAFISGLAIGSALGSRLARRVERPAVWLAGMLITSAVAASGAAWVTATRMPLVVAEYGVPSSRGIAHLQSQGWHHGGHDETAMAAIDARMTREIRESGAAAGRSGSPSLPGFQVIHVIVAG